MKKMTKVLGGLCALTFGLFNVQAGDHYVAPQSSHGGKHCAECCPNFYVFGFGGGTFSDEVSGLVTTAGVPISFDLDDGYVVGGGAGVRSDILGGFRFEVEGFYGENDVFNVDVNNNPNAATGSLETAGFHFNFIKEFRNNSFITPYAGVGVGYTNVSAENVQYGPITINDSDGAFSWQAIAGLEFKICKCAGIYVEYNYHSVGDIELLRSPTTTSAALDDISSHSVQGGIRIAF